MIGSSRVRRHFLFLVLLLGTSAVSRRQLAWLARPHRHGFTDEKDLPLRWDGKTKENLLWKVPWAASATPARSSGRTVFSSPCQKDRPTPKRRPRPSRNTGSPVTRSPTAKNSGAPRYLWGLSPRLRDLCGADAGSRRQAGLLLVQFRRLRLLWTSMARSSGASELPGPLPKRFEGLINSPLLFEDTVIRIVNADQVGGNGVVEALEKTTGKVKWEKKLAKDRQSATPRRCSCQ